MDSARTAGRNLNNDGSGDEMADLDAVDPELGDNDIYTYLNGWVADMNKYEERSRNSMVMMTSARILPSTIMDKTLLIMTKGSSPSGIVETGLYRRQRSHQCFV